MKDNKHSSKTVINNDIYKDGIINIINMKLSSNEYTNISENKEIIRNDNFHS